LTMFGDPTADVFHIVAFNITPSQYPDVRKLLADIKFAILDDLSGRPTLAGKYGIRDIWLARQISREPHSLNDDTTGAKLWHHHNPLENYILMMRFDDAQRLKGFMGDPQLLQLRLKLFGHFDGPVKELMQSLRFAAQQI
jgi:hypothetical protein